MSATNRGGIRIERDAYQTPQYAIDLILDQVNLNKVKSFLEPCRGEGRITKAIKEKASDISISWCEITEGKNYLTTKEFTLWKYDLILTNPPFSFAMEFLEKSLQEAQTVIYLLRLGFLGSKKRNKFFNSNRPTHLFVLSERPSFTDDGKTDAENYCFICWDRANLMYREPGIYWLPENNIYLEFTKGEMYVWTSQ